MCSLYLKIFECDYLLSYSFTVTASLSGVSLCRVRSIFLDPKQLLIHKSKKVTDAHGTVLLLRRWDVLVE